MVWKLPKAYVRTVTTATAGLILLGTLGIAPVGASPAALSSAALSPTSPGTAPLNPTSPNPTSPNPTSPNPTSPPESGGGHCWLDAATGSAACFDNQERLDESLAALGVRSAAAQPATLSGQPEQESTQASTTQASTTESSALTVIGVVYDNHSYGGASYTIFNSGGCTAGNGSFVRLTDVGWNDRTSSFKGYGGCRMRLHEHVDGSGSGYGPYASGSWLGWFDNKTSAISFVA